MAEVLQPKVDALWVLHRLLASAPPRVFMLFSSVSAVAPKLASGVLDYAAANRFLDLFAQYQHAHGHPYYRSVQWTRWRQMGLARDVRESGAAGMALDPGAVFRGAPSHRGSRGIGAGRLRGGRGRAGADGGGVGATRRGRGTHAPLRRRPLSPTAMVVSTSFGEQVRAIVARELEIRGEQAR